VVTGFGSSARDTSRCPLPVQPSLWILYPEGHLSISSSWTSFTSGSDNRFLIEKITIRPVLFSGFQFLILKVAQPTNNIDMTTTAETHFKMSLIIIISFPSPLVDINHSRIAPQQEAKYMASSSARFNHCPIRSNARLCRRYLKCCLLAAGRSHCYASTPKCFLNAASPCRSPSSDKMTDFLFDLGFEMRSASNSRFVDSQSNPFQAEPVTC